MKVTFLGTGTSTGVPYINCECEVCHSTDSRDMRLRSSLLLQEGDTNILIDCGPDFRQQILAHPVDHLDAVFITHEHYDHVGGMDDLRPFHGVNIYALERVCGIIRSNMPYCFNGKNYPGVPQMNLHSIDEGALEPVMVKGLKVIPVKCYHAALPILGYRIGSFAYMTDIKSIDESEMRKLEGVETLIVDALRQSEHFSHFSLEEAVTFSKSLNVKTTYFTHCCHHIGLYKDVQPTLAEGMYLAYDNLKIEVQL